MTAMGRATARESERGEGGERGGGGEEGEGVPSAARRASAGP